MHAWLALALFGAAPGLMQFLPVRGTWSCSTERGGRYTLELRFQVEGSGDLVSVREFDAVMTPEGTGARSNQAVVTANRDAFELNLNRCDEGFAKGSPPCFTYRGESSGWVGDELVFKGTRRLAGFGRKRQPESWSLTLTRAKEQLDARIELEGRAPVRVSCSRRSP